MCDVIAERLHADGGTRHRAGDGIGSTMSSEGDRAHTYKWNTSAGSHQVNRQTEKQGGRESHE
eukprot:4156-Eustigmatos_ZCMA.PRE.1